MSLPLVPETSAAQRNAQIVPLSYSADSFLGLVLGPDSYRDRAPFPGGAGQRYILKTLSQTRQSGKCVVACITGVRTRRQVRTVAHFQVAAPITVPL